MSDAPDDARPAAAAPKACVTPRDRLLLAAFWTWAALLLVAALAHLFGWQGILDLLDVKRLFAR
jgi:hypothetical protein